MPEEIQATMVLDRETKGTYLYKEVDENGKQLELTDENTKIGTLYVRKGQFGDKVDKIVVTITKE